MKGKHAMAPAPRCPYCGAKYYHCKTDWRGLCVKMPKEAS